MLHRPPGSKRAYTPCPYPTLFRSAYFFATARSVLLDKIRRDRIVRIESLSEMDALGLVDDDPGPERRASARLELQRVGRLIADLPDRCREIFEMRRVRSEECRVGNACVSTCSSRWAPVH